MKLRTCFYCIVINCVVILPYLSAKPVSLNKLIEAEEKSVQSRRQELPKPETKEKPRVSYKEPLTSKPRKLTRTGLIFSQDKIISPLQYRKTFQIKSPLKPRRVNLFRRPNKLKNQTTKRETYEYGILNEKYIPLLRNLGLLFDNILGPDSSETGYETKEMHTDHSYSDESGEVVCTCTSKKSTVGRRNETRQKAAASAKIIAIEVTTDSAEITTTSTYNTTNDYVSSVRRNKNVPLLLTRNTTSFRRNNTRFSEGNSTPYFRSAERHITGDCGNAECNTGIGKTGPSTENNEEISNGVTRDNARSGGLNVRTGDRNDTASPSIIGEANISDKFETTTDKTTQGFGRHLPQHEREIQFEVRGDEAEGSSAVSEPDSRLRSPESREETKPLQTTENYEEVTISEPHNDTANQQSSERNGEDTSENQKLYETNETVTSGNIVVDISSPVEKFVMIFDGYSVARDVNGKNTLTEKAMNLHT